jgi:FkbM family methyltransferase
VKISLVTISFNQARFLEQTILSVLNQDYTDLEYIIVDPGSTDGSREIIERYRDRIACVVFERDEGPADGLNRGFARATGDICGYLNSDDLLLPGTIARVAEAFRAHPETDVVYGHGYFIDSAGKVLRRLRSDRFSLRRSAYGNAIIMQQAAFWRRDVFAQAGGFNIANRLSWDGEFWIDLALAKRKFRRVDEYWACFRTHTESISHNFHQGAHTQRYEREKRRLLEKAMGRSRNPWDAVVTVFTRAEKWLIDPINLWIRLRDIFNITATIIGPERQGHRGMDFDLLKLRLRKLAAIAAGGAYRRAFLRHGVAPAIEHHAVLQALPFDLVVDVGANRGQFSLLCRDMRPAARIVAFEPLPAPAAIYGALFAEDAKVTLHSVALAQERGTMDMNISKSDDSSSLLPISKAQIENYPGTERIGSHRVSIAPLTDFISAGDLIGHGLLKIDVQGFELEVLKSGQSLLLSFDWIYVECSFVQLYEGQALAEEVIAFLTANGFRLSGRYNFSHGRGGALLQADLLFVRA